MCEVNHNRGLCGLPDLTGYGLSPEDVEKLNLPREIAEQTPPKCRCCGSAMTVEDTTSDMMNQGGMYWLTCPTCPDRKDRQQPPERPVI